MGVNFLIAAAGTIGLAIGWPRFLLCSRWAQHRRSVSTVLEVFCDACRTIYPSISAARAYVSHHHVLGYVILSGTAASLASKQT